MSGASVRSPHDGIDHARKNKCVEEASAAGIKGAALGISVSAPLVFAATISARDSEPSA